LCDGVERLSPDGNKARLVSLSGDTDDAVLGVEILQTCSGEFAGAESAGVKKLEHRLVPEPEWLRGVGGGEKALNVAFVERFGQEALDAGKRQDFGGIVRDARTGREPAEENLQRHDLQLDARRGEPGAFAMREKFLKVREHHGAWIDELAGPFGPAAEVLERAARGELVVVGQTALGREMHDEVFDIGAHGGRATAFARRRQAQRGATFSLARIAFCIQKGVHMQQTPADSRARFLEKLRTSLDDQTFVKLTLSRRRGAGSLRNVYSRIVELKAGRALSFTLREATRDVTRNESFANAPKLVEGWMAEDFEEAHLFTTTGDWRWKEGAALKASRPTFAAALSTAHDRPKVRAVANAPFLEKLGVTGPDGAARPGMADKLRQVERFVELLGHLVDSSTLAKAESIEACDMGAGKGYLTFAAHDFFQRRGARTKVTGVELRDGLVQRSNEVARSLGCEGLQFVSGEIGSFALPAKLDVLIALHACDTATDDALAAGIRAGAGLIVVAPCCHKEVRREFTPPAVLAEVLRHGILAERQAELLTDGLRAMLLEIAGYEAKVFEFISSEHTAKNLMLAAVKRVQPCDTTALRAQFADTMAFFGLRSQRLASLLGL